MAEPEFSRPVALARLGSEPFRQEIAASEAERALLARRFGLVAIDRLSATVELARQDHDRILLQAAFDAEFVQSCVVTLDPVRGAVSERFALLYGSPEAEAEAAGIGADDPAFEPIVGDTIDIGEAVAQEFGLVLPPYPRSAEADAETLASTTDEVGPFAALSRLIDRDRR